MTFTLINVVDLRLFVLPMWIPVNSSRHLHSHTQT
jgi:hypothetical protein